MIMIESSDPAGAVAKPMVYEHFGGKEGLYASSSTAKCNASST
jgi:hypothetical protein